MSCNEILTLQFGHYSNFVGTHWWNLQERTFEYNCASSSEINHDVLYREGITDQRLVTYTPRLLLVDLLGSLKALPERGELYEKISKPSQADLAWNENSVEIQETDSETKNKFQEDIDNPEVWDKVFCNDYSFDNEVQVWSDFLYSRFHPRTVNIVRDYQYCNENTPFDAFPLGVSLWKSPQFEEDFSDKIRNYIEECDHFQGFHILTDCSDAFAGLSSSCMEHLVDEYDRKSILVFPVLPSHFPDNDFNNDVEQVKSIMNDSVRVLNLTLGINAFAEHSSLIVPLSTSSLGWRQPGPKIDFNHVQYDHKLPYHSSAILAAALDTMTLKHRLKKSNFSLRDLSADLTLHGRKVAAASLCLPFGINEGADLLHCLDNWDGPLSKSITPRCKIGTSRVMQHVTFRGVSEDRLKKVSSNAGKQKELPAYSCKNITEMLSMYMTYTTEATASNITVVEKALDVRTPFPKIFGQEIGVTGNVSAKQRENGINVQHIPVLTGLHNESEMGDMLESLHTEARKLRISRFHQFTNSGIDRDEYEECLDNLFTLRENYEDSYLI